ncbi:MAG: hypothetical protein O9264_18625 [Leptospira sp.]|nr:hypothetical protein [Leptospira sp.]
MIFLFIISCTEEKDEIEISKTRPEHLPNFAKQLENGDWLLRDFENGYLAHWLNDGSPIMEVFLVNNLSEKIILTYPTLSNLKTYYKFKLLKENYFPLDTDELKNLEDDESRRKRLTKVYFRMILYMDPNLNDQIYPREFFNTVMWNSGPNISFKDGKLYSFICNTIIAYTPDVQTEKCGIKILHPSNSPIEKTSIPTKCNHSCSEKIDIIQKGYYKIKKYRSANIYSDRNVDSNILKTIEKYGLVQVLDNRINISDINYSNLLWIYVKSGKTSGYLLKSSIVNRKL